MELCSLTRFRFEGFNWELRQWVVSLAIMALGQQVETAWPIRHATDGTVAGKQHDQTSPNSDHRPHPFKGPGIVRAIDIGGYEEVDEMMESIRLSRDPRVRYAIRYGRIFSSTATASTPAYQWREYEGDNPHKTHGHLSTVDSADNDDSLWSLGGGEDEMSTQALRLIVAEAGNKGWLPTPDAVDFWLGLAETPNDPQWRNQFEPAWSKWKQDEGIAIRAGGTAGTPGTPGATATQVADEIGRRIANG